MPAKLERAEEKLSAGLLAEHRSSERLRKAQVTVKYDLHNKCLTIDRLEYRVDDEIEETIPLDSKNITHIKAKNYIEGAAFIWALCITHSGVQHCLVFGAQEDRDIVDEAMALHIRSATTIKTVEQNVTLPYWTIKNIEVREAEEGIAVALHMDLTCDALHEDKAGLILELREGVRIDQCKEIVVQWVQDHRILPTEGTSLYRLVKALMMRKQVKQETEYFIKEVSCLQFDELAKAEKLKPDNDGADLVVKANQRLDALALQLPERFGTSGTGAQLVSVILARNIEKMKMVNDLTGKLRHKELNKQRYAGAGSPASSPHGVIH